MSGLVLDAGNSIIKGKITNCEAEFPHTFSCKKHVHRSGQSQGKWLHRAIQWQNARRTTRSGIFFALEEAKILIARWKDEFNHIGPHIALG